MSARAPHRALGLAPLLALALATAAGALAAAPGFGAASAAPPRVALAPAEGEGVSLADVLDVVEDPRGTLTLEDVASGRAPARGPAGWRALAPGYTARTYWVHFRVRNPRPEAGEWRLELWRDVYDARLYTRHADGARTERRTGRALPVSARDLPARQLLLRLPLGAGEEVDCWLRLSSQGSLLLTPHLWSETGLSRASATTHLWWGMYYGALLAMLAYNLVLFLSTRDGVYLSYCLFQLGVTAMSAAGDQLLAFYLWPERPEWAGPVEMGLVALALAGCVDFCRRFLALRRLAPRLDGAMRALSLLTCLAALSPLVSHGPAAHLALIVLAVACLVCALGAAAWALRLRAPDAGIFLAAWVVLLVGGLLSILTLTGLLPATPLTDNVRLGSVVEAVLLSLSLGRRIQHLRQENERARTELLESRLAYSRTLEARVEERTRELTSALDELHAAQARLVQQARLASLGHLVAGVAHEVGNPLNFAAGGAEDLAGRLEAMRADAAGLTPGPPAEQLGRQLKGAARALALVQAGTGRIRAVLDGLRAYVRDGGGALQPVDVLAELETTLSLMHPRLEQAGVQVERDLEPLPALVGRPGELGQVFMNLLLNSCQAMPGGGRMRVSARRTPVGVELAFHDTGPGVPAAHRDAIFDPFFTTRPPNEGTGLGLSISHSIVTRNGGELRLAPSEAGARFVVSLPAQPERHGPSAG